MSTAAGSPLQLLQRPTLSVEIPPFTDTEFQLKPQTNPKRCCFDGCKKKLSLTDFACKCGKIHCAAHRPSEVHSCTYDYKKSHEANLLKTMSTAIVAPRVDKI